MQNYKKMFDSQVPSNLVLSRNYLKPIKSNTESKLEIAKDKKNHSKTKEDQNGSIEELNITEDMTKSHEISFHLEKLHHRRVENGDPELKQLESLKKLRKLVKKL